MNNDLSFSYQHQLNYLLSLQKYGIKFGLSQTANLLESFGNPHLGQKYVHIAGTNGKGSVASFLASILQKSGYKVGLYTSPHLVRFTERFQINFQEISKEEVTRLIQELRSHIKDREPPTFFEAVTALALTYFAQQGTDINVIEVGMGGRLDATNIIYPLLSVITNISVDHTEFLGHTLLQIAEEKAGIIKNGVPLITAATQKPVLDLFRKSCAQKEAPFYRLGSDFKYRSTLEGFSYYGLHWNLKNLYISLSGPHQFRNAALAIAGCELLEQNGFTFTYEHVQEGLKKTTWLGRMQIIQQNPLTMIDGAHNPEAMRTLARSIPKRFQYRQLILVLGIMADKDIDKMLKHIVPIADYIIYSRPVYPRALDPHELMSRASFWDKPGQVITPLGSAIRIALSLAAKNDLVLICGSLFTVGEALSFFEPQKYEPDCLI